MIKYKTVFNQNVQHTLNKQLLKRAWPALALFTLFMVVIGALLILYPESEDDFSFGIFLVVYGLLFVPFVYLLTVLISKKSAKTMKIMSEDTTAEFSFDGTYLEITQTKGDEFYGYTKQKYETLFKVIDTKDYFLLFISNNQSHVIPKNSIVEGSNDDLALQLTEVLGKKYKIRN